MLSVIKNRKEHREVIIFSVCVNVMSNESNPSIEERCSSFFCTD